MAGCRGRALARAPQSAELSFCSNKRRRGSKGEPSPGVPPFLLVCTCAPIRWEVFVSLSCDSTPFLWCLPKETVSSRQRKALFYPGGSTIRVSATASVDGGHLRPTCGGAGGHLSGCLRRGRTGFVMAALRGQSTARASLSLSGSAHLQKRVSLAARHRFFGQAPKKWGRRAGQANDHLPTYRRTRTNQKNK